MRTEIKKSALRYQLSIHRQSASIPRHSALCAALSAVLLALSVCAQAQKIPRIAYLTALSTAIDASRIEALRQGLRDLGYIDGKNIILEVRSMGETSDGLAALAAEVVRTKVDIIVSGGPTATRPAKEATSTIPIVMRRTAILSETDSSQAWRDRAGTLPDCRLITRRSVQNKSSC